LSLTTWLRLICPELAGFISNSLSGHRKINFGDNDMRRTLIASAAMIVAFIVAIPNA